MKKISYEHKQTAIQTIVSVISTLLVLLTLFEMQTARNATYMPNILFDDTEVAISWQGKLSDDLESVDIDVHLESVLSNYDVNATPSLKVYNIGVGTAKDVTIQWDNRENFQRLIAAFEPYNDIKIGIKNDMLYVETDTMSIGQGIASSCNFEFILSSTEEYETMLFPVSYHYLIGELFIRTPHSNAFPVLSAKITYTDIQNKSYSKEIFVQIEPTIYCSTPNDIGYCIYTLHFTEEENSTMLFNFLSAETLTAITSVCAVIISVISMVFTVIFSILQIKHNKNSVRPIAEIKVGDFEDNLFVRIDNVGTGPLLIQKLKVMYGEQESDTLISMMPHVEQHWTTFTENIDGRTLPVSGSATLIEMCPQNQKTKNLIRKRLSEITIKIEYTDIYSTKFHAEKTLDFFGRHFL